MNSGVSFSYNAPGMARSSDYGAMPSIADVPDEFRYTQSEFQAFYFIENVISNGEEITNDDWIITFHSGTVVGARQWQGGYTDIPAMGYDESPNTLNYLRDGDVPEFKLYDVSQHKLINLDVTAPAWENLGFNVLGEVSTRVELPTRVNLLPAYPNPFNPSTTIKYQIPEQTKVRLVVVNIVGQEVVNLVNTQQQPGEYSLTWDASDLASGIYFIRLVTENQTSIQKLMFIK